MYNESSLRKGKIEMILSVAGIIIGVVAIVAVIAILFAMSYVKAGPDTAIMVSGAGKKKY